MPFMIVGTPDGYRVDYPHAAEGALLDVIRSSGVPFKPEPGQWFWGALSIVQARPYCPRMAHLPPVKREAAKREWLAQWEETLKRVDVMTRQQAPDEVLWAMISPWSWKSVQLLSHDVGGLADALIASKSEPLRIIGDGLLLCAQSPAGEEAVVGEDLTEDTKPAQLEPYSYAIGDTIPRD